MKIEIEVPILTMTPRQDIKEPRHGFPVYDGDKVVGWLEMTDDDWMILFDASVDAVQKRLDGTISDLRASRRRAAR
jgi:hypothetical protein